MSDNESTTSSQDLLAQNDLNNQEIVTKYRLAGEFATYALQHVIAASKPGVRIVDLCKLGDAKIVEKTSSVYTKPVVIDGEKVKIDRGIAFPTCVSVNNVLANFSPSESDVTVLKEGDIAKIELSAHIDGYIASVAHTVVVGGEVLTGRRADVVIAAQNALEASLRLLKKGTSSEEIVKTARKVAEAYGVSAVEGVTCHGVKRFVLSSNKEIPIKPRVEDKAEHFEIEDNEVYTMEMTFTTGEDGKCSGKDGIVTVYRRAVDVTYMLKLKAARQLFSEINSNAPTLAFGMRDFENKLGATAKLGLKEINEHSLLHPYYVLVEKPSETIATFKCTCLVLPSGVVRLSGAEYPKVQTEKKIQDEEVVKLLLGSLKKKTTNNKKKAKKPKADGAKDEDGEDEEKK